MRELLRGSDHIAGEFAHVPLNLGRSAMHVRRQRLLGVIHIEPGDAFPLFRVGFVQAQSK